MPYSRKVLFFTPNRKLQDELLEAGRGKDVLGNVLQLGSCEGVNLLQQLTDAALFSVVKEMFGEVECILLAVVAGNGNLSLELSLGN